MLNVSMLLLPVLLLLTDLHGVLAVASTPSYEHRDPGSGQLLTCARCPPGTRLAAHCTATSSTECAPCHAEHFTAAWNYLPRCLYCNNFCRENQEVERECSPVSNRVCRCMEGHYSKYDFCIRHSECGPGHGAKTKGSPQTNTVCEKCVDGHFSNSSSALDSCVKHQECSSSGQRVLLTGSAFHDVMCGSCKDLKRGGGVKVLRIFLQQFFAGLRMRVQKMKTFVRHIQKAGEDLPTQRAALRRHIIEWLAQAPEEQLRKFPERLRALRLRSLASRLKKRLKELQQRRLDCN
ncbi:tumor necrosis factor receptor superfamily member 6B-like [Diretmus argenteus]